MQGQLRPLAKATIVEGEKKSFCNDWWSQRTSSKPRFE
jgi:hypothetical protein